MPPLRNSLPTTLNRSWQSWAILGFLVITWGSSFALTKIAVLSYAPEWVITFRLAIGALVLVIFIYATGRRMPRLATWPNLIILALTGYVLPFWSIAWGLQYIETGLTGMLMTIMPLGVLVMAHLFLPDERASPVKLIGVVIGFVGAVIVIGPEKLLSLKTQGLAVWGQLAILAGAMFYALHSVIARRMPEADFVERSAGVCLVSAVLAAGLAIGYAPAIDFSASLEAWVAIVILAIFPTAIAAIATYILLERAGAGFLSIVNYLIPPYAALLGALALGERLPLQVFIGFGLIVAGLAVSEYRSKRH